jgi:ABC-type bacteriocin/lantibiotic exporter with double-glycine peptidase domain
MELAPRPAPELQARTIAIRVLELFAAKTGVALDRLLAARAMGEAERAIPGDEAATWCRRLVEVGESVDLRVQTSEAPLRDALDLVRQGMPVAACLDRGAGRLQWVALAGSRGRRVLVGALEPGAADRWLTVRELCQTLGIEAPTSRLRWVVAQPAFACESVSHHAEHEASAHVSPLTRLVKLLRPEAKDLWVIVVFSVFVGLLVLATPIAVEALVDTVAFGRYLQPVVVLAVLLFTFLAFAAAIRALLSYIVEIVQRRLDLDVVDDLSNAVQPPYRLLGDLLQIRRTLEANLPVRHVGRPFRAVPVGPEGPTYG